MTELQSALLSQADYIGLSPPSLYYVMEIKHATRNIWKDFYGIFDVFFLQPQYQSQVRTRWVNFNCQLNGAGGSRSLCIKNC